MHSTKLDLLDRPLFLIALTLLLLNDFYLKYEFANVLTGKLSDVAGLFLFPYFLSSFRIKWAKHVYMGTGILFLFWKSEFSQEIIDGMQGFGIGIDRVVDYTDLIALLILPFSYKYFKTQLAKEQKWNRALTIPMSLLTLFAICATTLPRKLVQLNTDTDKAFELPMSKSDFFKSLTVYNSDSDINFAHLSDSLFYLTFYISDYKAQVTILANIRSTDNDETLVILDSIKYAYMTGGLFIGANQLKSLTDADFERYFETCFIDPVIKKEAKYLYYRPK